jgi:uncharacterized protein (TIGR03382 family)
MRRLVASIAALIPVMALGVVPSDGGPLTVFTSVDIDTSAGDQYDPHVNGDIAAYTTGTNIAYYNFAVGSSSVVPGGGGVLEDQLSDVSNGRIVFSRFDNSSFTSSIMVWDTDLLISTEIDPGGSATRTNGAIGADTVAFIDFANNNLYAAQLGVPGSMPVTTDSRIDRQPQVAPAGNLIVYESCQTVASNCDVRQAAWSGSSWVVTALTDNADPESNPDTDGLRVVYDANRAGEQDIYWQPVGGGSEQRLALAGLQRNPSVSAGVVAFESVAVGDTTADVYVYDMASNRMFQITSTPSNEALNDVYVLPDGRVRVVWSSGPESQRDVYGATFELPGGGGTGGGSGGSGGSGGGSCTPTIESFSASINYHKHSWDDGAVDHDNLGFSIPASIPTTEGNAANGTLFLSFWQDGGEVVKCLYKGDGQTGDGRTSSSFLFHHCTVASVTAGSTVTADHVRVRVQNADENLAKTSVGVTIGTGCPPDTATVQLGNEAPTTVGCSSSGGTFTFAALVLALLAWMAPRRVVAPVRSRRPTR